MLHTWCDCTPNSTGRGVVDDGEVFRTPGWSAGPLHLHFSVARGVPAGEEEVASMLKEGESKPHVERRPVNRVSSAVWPRSVRRVVATGKAAQRRRDWIMQGRWWVALADVLPMRILLVIATLLVVVSSLLVAVLGLRFWFLLPLPLLLFLAVLMQPLFLASRIPPETIPSSFSGLTQEMRSSSGLLSLHSQELRSNPGFLQELRSNPGFLQDLRSNPGFLQELRSNPGFLQDLRSNSGLLSSEAPATPMPADQPLVRVLETYDLREPHCRQQLDEPPRRETGRYRAVRYSDQDAWPAAAIEPLEEKDEDPENSADL